MLNLLSKEDFKRLLSFFLESDYNQTNLRDRIGFRELPSRRLGNVAYLLKRTGEESRFNILLRWFFVGVSVPDRTAKEQIPSKILTLLLRSGLLSSKAGEVFSSVMIVPFENFLIVSDPMVKAESGEHSDLVLWPNPSSWLLSRFTIRKPFDKVLDLGSGCGMQAFSAASHARHVTGVDLNERATEFAQFNARFNAIENAEFVTGDSFAPVEGDFYDLIVSNPPFFVGPLNQDMYCDNPLELDQYCRFVVREGASRLNENGFLQIVCEWVEVDQPWKERITEWIEHTGCDAWVLKAYSEDPLQYAYKRIQERSLDSTSERDLNYSKYIEYYQRLRVKAIYGGLIALHRRSGSNWAHWSDLPTSPKEAFGGSILQGFENRDFLLRTSDQALLEIKPRLSPDARLLQESRQDGQSWISTSLRLQLTSGIPNSLAIQPLVGGFVAECDGGQSVSQMAASLARRVGANPTQVEQECVLVVRRLLQDGYLFV